MRIGLRNRHTSEYSFDLTRIIPVKFENLKYKNSMHLDLLTIVNKCKQHNNLV